MEKAQPVKKGPSKALAYTLLGCALLITAGIVVSWNYMIFADRQRQEDARLPMIRPLFNPNAKPLVLSNQFGEQVNFPQLRGKIWVAAFVYTRCRAGCLGVVAHMKKLQEELGEQTDFHMVSVTIDPEHDTPEFLADWTKKNEVGGKSWWFLTGEGESLRRYMTKEFQLAIQRRTDPEQAKILGDWEHSFMLALVDQNGVIRNYYDLMNEQTGEQAWDAMRKDIQRLRKEAKN